jgi:hypothetical protein
MITYEERLLNDFATRSFRDVADHDYVLARLAYRSELFPQFHWCALQAIEKYLKAILLYNRIPAKHIYHEIAEAMKLCKKLSFPLSLSSSTKALLEYLDDLGRFRYLEISYYIHGPKLVALDKAVWEIRRYCRVLNYEMEIAPGKTKNMLSMELARIAASEKPRHRIFRLNGGLLEKIIDKPGHPARGPLLWQNAFFGKRTRKVVRMHTPFQATNSPLTLNPQILDDVLKYVKLGTDVANAYRAELQKKNAQKAKAAKHK